MSKRYVGLCLIAIGFVLVCGVSFGAEPSESSGADFIILQPQANSQIDHVCVVTGKAAKHSADKVYRVVVFPHILQNYHPQGGRLIWKDDGLFEGRAYVGNRDASVGEVFDILVVETDQAGSTAFDTYLANAARTGEWNGMNALPPNTNVIARVTDLIRK